MSENEITLREAADLAHIKPVHVDDDTPDEQRPANQPGAEATAALEAMLAASRRGKHVTT